MLSLNTDPIFFFQLLSECKYRDYQSVSNHYNNVLKLKMKMKLEN